MFIEALAAGIVGAALLWLVLQPLLLPSTAPAELLDIPDPEETARGQALIALLEIDFDKATGKLSETDYQDLHARYSAMAVAAMALEAPAIVNDPLEAMIAARAQSKHVATCPVHGVRVEPEARFCSLCGVKLR